MRKAILVTLFVCVAAFIFAQNLSLSHEGTVLEPNEVIKIHGEANNTEMIIELDVTNNGSVALDVLVKKVENYIIDGSENTFCWAGLCFAPFVYVSPYSVNIGAGVTHTDDFSGHYNPLSNEGESSISYVFFDANNINDSIMVTVLFTTLTSGFGENIVADYSISNPYPNPASSFVKFDYDFSVLGNTSMKIYSLVGSLVREIKLTNNSGTLQVNTGNLEEGFYFYKLANGSNELKTGKFVVQH